jgi:adenosylhomocysteine nucleosidase
VPDDRPIAILTALDLEYDAVRTHLVDRRLHRHRAGTRFEVGRRAGDRRPIVLGLAGKGNHPAAVLAERVIAEFAPAAMLFVGVAGALRPTVSLGTVVVATHVYAYHGGTSEDDGFKARPRVWEISHGADQIARHVSRDRTWLRDLPDGEEPPVKFGPIAAGEVVQDSAISAHAGWVRRVYNDAVAIEMESAGVAQAAHLNNSLPTVVVRGISDHADGTKVASDGQRWQPRAARNAAAFAVALATELGREVAGAGPAPDREQVDQVRNIATGGSFVGVQAGRIFGGVTFAGRPEEASPGPRDETSAFRRLLVDAVERGDVDDATFRAAVAELDVVQGSPSPSEAVLALRRLRGLVLDEPGLAAAVTAMLRRRPFP